jgi:hypothetical protein
MLERRSDVEAGERQSTRGTLPTGWEWATDTTRFRVPLLSAQRGVEWPAPADARLDASPFVHRSAPTPG